MNRSFGTFLRCICTGLLLACATEVVSAASPVWEQVTTSAQVDMQDGIDRFDVSTRNGYVYISVSRPVTVKIYTILGQLVSQKSIPAGTFRLPLKARGIYILKMGEVTRRITI